MFYDFHMHSCLSPCAENEMTPNNICNMAKIKGLDIIAVTDHNSTKQLNSIKKVADTIGLRMLFGAELESKEEVHILALFNTLEKANRFQTWIDQHMPIVENNEDYFGNQYLMNEKDEIVGKEYRLLLVSLDASVENCIDAIHEYGGKAIIAHVLDRVNSITHQLGFIPQDLNYDGLEVKSLEQKQRVIDTHPWITETSTNWFIDSDAHLLVDISEAVNSIDDEVFNKLWGDES